MKGDKMSGSTIAIIIAVAEAVIIIMEKLGGAQ